MSEAFAAFTIKVWLGEAEQTELDEITKRLRDNIGPEYADAIEDEDGFILKHSNRIRDLIRVDLEAAMGALRAAGYTVKRDD